MMKSGKFAAVFAVFALGLGSAVHAAPPPQQQTVAAATGSVAPELDVAAWAQGGAGSNTWPPPTPTWSSPSWVRNGA